jgi:hypothetical protein
MADQAEALRTNELYEQDFYAWTQEQARLLRERRFDDLDLVNLIDEVESVGRSDKRQIDSRTEVLLAHLLKWKFQPGGRSSGWSGTIVEQRSRIEGLVEESPSLKPLLSSQVPRSYRAARLLAAKDTGIAYGVFPKESPFTPEQVYDPDFFPEDPGFE